MILVGLSVGAGLSIIYLVARRTRATVLHAIIAIVSVSTWLVGIVGANVLLQDLVVNGLQRRKENDGKTFDTYMVTWHCLYYTNFLLGWIILPFLTEFQQNGEFKLKARVLSSLRNMLFRWMTMAIVAAVMVTYLILVGHLTILGIFSIMLACANVYSLLLLTILLGHGLIELPRSLWKDRTIENRLRSLYLQATHVYEERMEAVFAYEDIIKSLEVLYKRLLQAEQRSVVLSTDMQRKRTCILEVAKLLEKDDIRKVNSFIADSSSDKSAPTFEEIVHLHRRARVSKESLLCSEQAWSTLCVETNELELVIDSKTDAMSVCTPSSTKPHVRLHLLRCVLFQPAQTILASLAASFSVWILLEELFARHHPSLSVVSLLLSIGGIELAKGGSLCLLLYMTLCAFWSIAQLRQYASLVCIHSASTAALLVMATWQSRLQLAVGYSFLLFLDASIHAQRTAFYHLFAPFHPTQSLADKVSSCLPWALLVLAGFALQGGYKQVFTCIGLNMYDDECLSEASRVDRGKHLTTAKAVKSRTTDKSSRVYGYSPDDRTMGRALLDME